MWHAKTRRHLANSRQDTRYRTLPTRRPISAKKAKLSRLQYKYNSVPQRFCYNAVAIRHGKLRLHKQHNTFTILNVVN